MRAPSYTTRAEMVKKISKEAYITNKAANQAINILFGILKETVGEQKAFVIPGLCSIRGELRPERMGTNPKNGQKMMLKEKLVVKIKTFYKTKKETISQ